LDRSTVPDVYTIRTDKTVSRLFQFSRHLAPCLESRCVCSCKGTYLEEEEQEYEHEEEEDFRIGRDPLRGSNLIFFEVL